MNLSELRRAAREVELSNQYDAELVSTAQGRQSTQLRQQAQVLLSQGRRREALHLFHQALACHREDDLGAAATSARHDLAQALSEDLGAKGWELVTAEQLYRRALKSPSRNRSRYRRAQTKKSLGTCLRKQLHIWGVTDRSRVDEIERLYREALEDQEYCGLIGLQEQGELHLNLGNFFWQDRHDHDRAIRHYERAFAIAQERERISRSQGAEPGSELPVEQLLHKPRLALSRLLRARNQGEDLDRAEQLATAVLQTRPPEFENSARLELAEVLLAGDAPDRLSRAQALLAQVELERLGHREQWAEFTQALERAEAPDAALLHLERFIDQGIQQRARETIADFEADAVSETFQRAASAAARLRVKQKQDALGAFLTLENTSGLRFAEMVSTYAWRPETPLSQALSDERRQRMHRTYLLDALARSIDWMAPDAQRQHVRLFLQLQESHPAVEKEVGASFLESLRRAATENPPVKYLDSLAQEGLQGAAQALQALLQVDAGFARSRRVLGEELERSHLLELLREHPDHVLLRLDLQEELLAVAVWLEAGELVAQHTTLAVPSRLFALLAEATTYREKDPFRDYASLAELVARLDLSPALPPGRLGRVVVLPSMLAAWLPLAGLGPAGARLIDRADSLIWLPCLYPLRIRPAATPPRQGEVVVAPVPHKMGAFKAAFAGASPGTRFLEGAQATPEAILEAARGAHTFCFYTHGEHEPEEVPRLQMANEQFEPSVFEDALKGAERVELWACRSGVHLPADPMTPPVNEGFGLDLQFLQYGARTAIGTLWSVPELPTAAMVRRFRRHVAEGMDAARALAEAQRWWLREGAPEFMRLLRTTPEQALSLFFASLGAPSEAPVPPVLLGSLSGASTGAPAFTLDDLEAGFFAVTAWAGIRFVGVPHQEPERPWAPVEDRPLTPEERSELERLLSQPPPVPPPSFDEHQEEALARAVALAPDASPSPAQALEVARAFRDRLNSSHSDNLLAALAWLHEALATPGLAEPERLRLSVEAAHLWLDLAWGEVNLPLEPEPVMWARAAQLLSALPSTDSVDAETARVRLQILQRFADVDSFEDGQAILREALARLAPVLDRATPGTPEAIRTATVALELLDRCLPHARAPYTGLIEAARRIAAAPPETAPLAAAWHRLQGALAPHVPDAELAPRALTFFTPRELVSAIPRISQDLQPLPATAPHTLLINDALSRLEGGVWGYSSDNGLPLLLTTGTTGEAYRRLLALYLEGHTLHHPDDAAHKLACLQYACDLRLMLLHRLARISAWREDGEDPLFSPLWTILELRRSLHTALADAARLPRLPAPDQGPREPHPLDPFTLSPPTLRERAGEDFTCRTAWLLAQTSATVWRTGAPRARTAAFEAFRASQELESHLRESWELLTTTEGEALGAMPEAPSPSALLSEGRELIRNESQLRMLPAGEAMLGLSALRPDVLLLVACWNDGTGLGQRVVRLESIELFSGLCELLAPQPDDAVDHRGRSGPRREAWAALEAELSPTLEALLATAHARRPLRWSLLAPGLLRPLPLLGLRVGGRLLAERVAGLTHLPSLGFGSLTGSEPAPDFTACLLARVDQEGLTGFGEAAVETLRRAHSPALVLDVHQRRGTHLPEVDALERHAERIRTLRLYGTGSIRALNPSTVHLRLEASSALQEYNLANTRLTDCEVVELWASTSPIDLADRVLREETDRIPGLAAGFLANGAAAVIDLAWPVHDLVKALVCEQYGLLRLQHGHGPHQLARALTRTAGMLEAVRARGPYRTVREVLEQVDAQRQAAALHPFGVDPQRVVPFADRATLPAVASQSASEFVEEICHPVHLGAFRWWGA